MASTYGAGPYGAGPYGRALFPPPPPPPPGPGGGPPSTQSTGGKARDRLPLSVAKLPSPPKEYNQQDQAAVRRAVEQAHVLGPTVRAAHFVFSGEGESHEVILPFPCKAIGVRATSDALASDATFKVYFAVSELASLLGVGGTDPEIVAAKGMTNFALDWDTLDYRRGGVLSVTLETLVTGTRATFTIELEHK